MDNIPELRFSGFDKPWESGKLGNLINSLDAGISVNSGDRAAKNNEKGILKTSCVSNGPFGPNENKLVDALEEIIRLKEPVLANTIIISRMNTPALVGANAFIDKDYSNLFLPDRLWAGKISENHNPKWVGFLTAHPSTRAIFTARGTGTSGSMKNITKGDVLTTPISFPIKKEQQKIADFLSSVDNKISLLTEKQNLLQRYKKGVMQRLFSQEIRFKDEQENDFPDWEEKKFGEIFSRVKRKNQENDNNVLTISAQKGLINQEKYFNKSVSAKDVTGYYLLKKGEFAYNKSYSKGYPMGAIKRLNRYEKGVVSTLYICFATKLNISGEFYEQYFDAGLLNQEIQKIAQEGARNHGLLNISVVEFFSDIKVYLPKLEEQLKIANFLIEMDNKIDSVTQQIEQTKTFKKGLLQKMFV